ncbi:MAG: nitronate monooxygenase, partial [Prolixibacteraceae bacterium]|nr:nitronate monooxygenase [Prolixibacteraceae bacterium]
MNNRITSILNIKYPIIAGGMVWCSGWELASAVSNAGGLGLIGSGSMYPDVLKEHIQKCKRATDKPFGVNVPLIHHNVVQIMNVIMEEKISVVFTSAGSPMIWTKKLHEKGIKVIHVIANTKFAVKCEEVGVDAIVAEGFEAGGHNGKEETTTMVLIPQICKATGLPLIAAGGIATGKGMLAAFALGADGIQMGTRFALSKESSASEKFKEICINLKEGDTMLSLKKITPTRLIKNEFYKKIEEAENRGVSKEGLSQIIGSGRSKKGIFDGDIKEGELEIGQISSLINEIQSSKEIIDGIIAEYNDGLNNL